MATIKYYTDISQSKKLAEILPLESADMTYIGSELIPYPYCDSKFKGEDNVYSAWSLAALLNVLPRTINFGYENDSIFVLRLLENGKYLADYYEVSYVKDNPVDACYELILKLHELKKL